MNPAVSRGTLGYTLAPQAGTGNGRFRKARFSRPDAMIACQFCRANICSMSVERRYELETLRRSLAMLRPGAPALDREEAMRLVRELQDLERQLRRLRRGLQELLSDSR
jgi:hypothetical protein